MARSVRLLLTENVDNLGTVGDIVNVRTGYARNYFLPNGFATEPSEDLVQELATKRADAEKQLAALRSQREAMISKIDGIEITMQRACNDQGQLYGSVTQQDIAEALTHLGFAVKPREVRLAHTIKRLDVFDVSVKFDSDLEAHIKLHVIADREMTEDERDEMEFDNEGNLVEKSKGRRGGGKPAESSAAEAQPAEQA